MGESLGTGVATYLASEVPEVKRLYLQSPYTSITDIAQKIYPILPISLLLKNKFEAYKYTQSVNIETKVFIYYAEEDNTVPKEFSLNLVKYFKQDVKIKKFESWSHDTFGHGDQLFWNQLKLVFL